MVIENRKDQRSIILFSFRLAPEVLKSFEYNRAADIYAFGILVWEIFANGAIPYDTMNNAQIKEGVQVLLGIKGQRSKIIYLEG